MARCWPGRQAENTTIDARFKIVRAGTAVLKPSCAPSALAADSSEIDAIQSMLTRQPIPGANAKNILLMGEGFVQLVLHTDPS